MAKVAINLRNSHLWRNFSIMEQFDSMLSPIIDQTLGQRCRSIIGYQYSEIIRSLMSVYFCGGSCVEDVTSHLMRHLSYHPTLRTCSSDTILRAIKELTQENISYTSDKGKTYDFNTADKLNALLIKALVSTGELNEVESYDVDFDHQFLETEKYDANRHTRSSSATDLAYMSSVRRLSMLRTAMATQMCAFIRLRPTRDSLPYWKPTASV